MKKVCKSFPNCVSAIFHSSLFTLHFSLKEEEVISYSLFPITYYLLFDEVSLERCVSEVGDCDDFLILGCGNAREDGGL